MKTYLILRRDHSPKGMLHMVPENRLYNIQREKKRPDNFETFFRDPFQNEKLQEAQTGGRGKYLKHEGLLEHGVPSRQDGIGLQRRDLLFDFVV